MSQPIAPEARPKLGRTKAARQMLLTMCTSPTPAHIHALEPDEAGALRYVSRQETLDRKLPVYTGKPSTLDKPFSVRGAPAGFGEWAATIGALQGAHTQARYSARTLALAEQQATKRAKKVGP